MDREQVLQWARDAGLGYISANGNYVAAYRHSKEHVAEFARLVHNAALDEAKAVCLVQASEPECPERALYCADEIESLKEPKP